MPWCPIPKHAYLILQLSYNVCLCWPCNVTIHTHHCTSTCEAAPSDGREPAVSGCTCGHDRLRFSRSFLRVVYFLPPPPLPHFLSFLLTCKVATWQRRGLLPLYAAARTARLFAHALAALASVAARTHSPHLRRAASILRVLRLFSALRIAAALGTT